MDPRTATEMARLRQREMLREAETHRLARETRRRDRPHRSIASRLALGARNVLALLTAHHQA